MFNQYGRGFNQNNAGQRPFNNFGRGGNGAFSDNCAFSKGFGYQGYQGHIAYPEPTQSDHVPGIPFGSFYSSPSNPAAFNCYNGVNNDQKFNQNQNSVAPFISSPEVIEDPSWYIDSGASSHITNDSGKLLDFQPYFGSEELLVGNGNGLKIKHIGSVLLATYSHKPLLLNHVLHVPHITKNLLSVSQLLTDNNVLVEFVDNLCLIKARNSGILLLRGIAKEGLYQIQDVISSNFEVSKSTLSAYYSQIPTHKHLSMFATLSTPDESSFSSSQSKTLASSSNVVWKPTAMSVSNHSVDVNLLHQRLGHPAIHILKTVMKHCNTFADLNKTSNLLFCTACQLGKNHLQHFGSVKTKTTAPLQLIYADLWGPSHITSTQGYNYYLSILDDFSRFTWLFPLKAKSDALQVFTMFKTFIEQHLDRKIKIVQTDWGANLDLFLPY